MKTMSKVDWEDNAMTEAGGALDSFQQYLHEIGQYPLLTAEEEKILSARVMAAEESAKLLESGVLAEELRDTAQQVVRQGKQARDRLAEANLRLVVAIARGYLNRGMSLPDLVQAGNLGLIRATEDFNGAKGNRFSTYASWWIKQYITRSLADQCRTIRLPVHVHNDVLRLRRTQRELIQELDRQPTVEELTQAMGLSEKKVRQLLEVSRETLSLNMPTGEGEECAEFGDFLPAENSFDQLERELCKDALTETLNRVLDGLDEKERYVLARRYGLFGCPVTTLEEIGRALNLTRERVRQIENKAMRKLRAPECQSALRDFIA